MKPSSAKRRLIVNADDFGLSRSVNEAVIRAHREGVLTTASLMVNGGAFEEAVALALANPGLGVGLHLTLVHGRATLPREKIPGLVDANGEFSYDPVRCGMNYFFKRSLLPELRAEIAAQFEKFQATGLLLDHVNGHLNMHLHPVIFRLLCGEIVRRGVRAVRVTRDPFWLNARLAGGAWLYRASHALIYLLLSARARGPLRNLGARFTGRVFGLLQNARVDEAFVLRLLGALPEGDSELYSHPSLDEFLHEFEALISPRVRQGMKERGIELIRYQDL